MSTLIASIIAFFKGKGLEIFIVSSVISLVRFTAAVMGVLRFNSKRPLKQVIFLLIQEVFVLMISFSLAVLAGYMTLSYQSIEDPQFWALGMAAIVGIIGHNILTAAVQINFDGLQGYLDSWMKK